MTDLIQPSRKGVLRNLYFAGFFLICIVLWSFHEPSRGPAGAQISPIPRKPADTSYYLIGQKQAFQLLAQAILSPRDVTDNQRESLMQWVSTARVLEQRPDSLNQKIKK